jgi:hypothetical protein
MVAKLFLPGQFFHGKKPFFPRTGKNLLTLPDLPIQHGIVEANTR